MEFGVTHNVPGRFTKDEIVDLKIGMDFRLPEYRRKVFLDFYKFHLQYKTHPGCVYFAMPWLQNLYNMDLEDAFWMTFINGCSQNIVTTWIIMQKFPNLKDLKIDELNDWWNINHIHFKVGSGWDSDRKYFKIGKTGFPYCVENYQKLAKHFGGQTSMFHKIMVDPKFKQNKYDNFRQVWDYVRSNFVTFGRLSAFSYLEYLRVVGLNIDCDSLFLEDMSGSKSHRNGLCKVLGRDDLDWHDTINPEFNGNYSDVLPWLVKEGGELLEEARTSINHKDVSYFTLESTLCCYKSWSRPNRRYPNVYTDMMYNRIKYAESEWPDTDFSLFWKMRKDSLPPWLRLEDNPNDPGLSKEKQNHYRLTGQVIMMDKDFHYYKNDFNDKLQTNGLEGYFS